jgi:hypothetical protein
MELAHFPRVVATTREQIFGNFLSLPGSPESFFSKCHQTAYLYDICDLAKGIDGCLPGLLLLRVLDTSFRVSCEENLCLTTPDGTSLFFPTQVFSAQDRRLWGQVQKNMNEAGTPFFMKGLFEDSHPLIRHRNPPNLDEHAFFFSHQVVGYPIIDPTTIDFKKLTHAFEPDQFARWSNVDALTLNIPLVRERLEDLLMEKIRSSKHVFFSRTPRSGSSIALFCEPDRDTKAFVAIVSESGLFQTVLTPKQAIHCIIAEGNAEAIRGYISLWKGPEPTLDQKISNLESKNALLSMRLEALEHKHQDLLSLNMRLQNLEEVTRELPGVVGKMIKSLPKEVQSILQRGI